MKRYGKLILVLAGALAAGAVLNVLIVEVRVQRKISSVTLGMTTNQVLAVLGDPTSTGWTVEHPGGKPAPPKAFVAYQYAYSWDYISLLWSRDLLFSPSGCRGMMVEFDQTGTACAVWSCLPYHGTTHTVMLR